MVGAGSFIAISLTTNVFIVAIALALYIAHAVVWNLMAASVRQRATPAAMMGRVGSVGRLIGLIGLAVGAGAGGLLAAGLGYRVPFAIAGVVFLVAAVLCLVSINALREWEDNESQAAASNAGEPNKSWPVGDRLRATASRPWSRCARSRRSAGRRRTPSPRSPGRAAT